MFVVVQPEKPQQTGFFHRLFFRGRKDGITVEKHRAGEADYYLLRMPFGKDGPDFQHLKETAGREAGRLLLPEDFYLPAQAPVGRYDSSDYLRDRMLYGVLHILQASTIEAARLSVAVCDMDARWIAQSCTLLQKAAEVYIVTACTGRYQAMEDYTLHNYGAYFTLLEPPCTLPDCLVVLAPFGLTGCSYREGRHLVFSQVKQDGAYRVTDHCITLPDDYAKEIPQGIAPGIFAAALCERCGIGAMERLLPRFFIRSGQKFSLNEIGSRLEMLDIGGCGLL